VRLGFSRNSEAGYVDDGYLSADISRICRVLAHVQGISYLRSLSDTILAASWKVEDERRPDDIRREQGICHKIRNSN